MDWLKISLIGVLSLVSFLVMLENADLRKSIFDYRVKMEEYKAELQRCDENKAEFIWIAEDVANANGWEANVYDCSEFSEDLVKELEKNGYKARVVRGWWYYIDGETCEGEDLEEFDCRHDWVCLGEKFDTGICIEATEGTLIPHSLYGTEYVFQNESYYD